jgi:AICAR transformylase/IMP cyclohydrolase PurH
MHQIGQHHQILSFKIEVVDAKGKGEHDDLCRLPTVEQSHPWLVRALDTYQYSVVKKGRKAAQSIALISIVICNLYLFMPTIARLCSMPTDAVELIDISGVPLLCTTAKNYERISVVSDPAHYTKFVKVSAKSSVVQAI